MGQHPTDRGEQCHEPHHRHADEKALHLVHDSSGSTEGECHAGTEAASQSSKLQPASRP
jgi:hypothetical protein